MKRNLKTIGRGIVILALACMCTVKSGNVVDAAPVADKENGISYDDYMVIDVGYYGVNSYSNIDIDFAGDRIGNVKSNSKNLRAKKIKEAFEHASSRAVSIDTYSYAQIGFYAKKKGTYKVTFDVIKSDGTVRCTKTIKVKAMGESSYAFVQPHKEITYAGKPLEDYNPYTKKKSGKLKVSMKEDYKLVSIEIGKYNKRGEVVYKKVKNNKKITLATASVYQPEYRDGGYEGQVYDDLFPFTFIRITYKNKNTGEKESLNTGLYYLNKKQMWK